MCVCMQAQILSALLMEEVTYNAHFSHLLFFQLVQFRDHFIIVYLLCNKLSFILPVPYGQTFGLLFYICCIKQILINSLVHVSLCFFFFFLPLYLQDRFKSKVSPNIIFLYVAKFLSIVVVALFCISTKNGQECLFPHSLSKYIVKLWDFCQVEGGKWYLAVV